MNEVSDKAFDLKSLMGPTFKNGVPSCDEWEKFIGNVNHEQGQAIARLWYQKAVQADGVPQRKDFNFEELVKYGTNIYIGKLNDEGRWETTFCGGGIVDGVGFDVTGKTLEDFGSPETVKFWTDNLDILVKECRSFIEFYTLEFANKNYKHCTAFNFPLKSGETGSPDLHMTYEIFTRESLFPAELK